MSRTFELPTRRETRRLSEVMAKEIRASDLLVLSGPLGAGKTFLVRRLCRELGLPGEERVTSPTFTLVHEYETKPPAVHADLYRLKTPDDVLALGLVERRDAGAVLLIEWGEPFLKELGGDAVLVRLETSPRRAVLSATGPRSEAFVRALAEPRVGVRRRKSPSTR